MHFVSISCSVWLAVIYLLSCIKLIWPRLPFHTKHPLYVLPESNPTTLTRPFPLLLSPPKRTPAGEMAAPTTPNILWGMCLHRTSGISACPCFALHSFFSSGSRPRLSSCGTSRYRFWRGYSGGCSASQEQRWELDRCVSGSQMFGKLIQPQSRLKSNRIGAYDCRHMGPQLVTGLAETGLVPVPTIHNLSAHQMVWAQLSKNFHCLHMSTWAMLYISWKDYFVQLG